MPIPFWVLPLQVGLAGPPVGFVPGWVVAETWSDGPEVFPAASRARTVNVYEVDAFRPVTVAVVPLTAVAGLGHWAIGNVDGGMLASLLVGSIPGILLASWFSPRVPEKVLRVLLGLVLTVVGVRLVSG